jgi:hypothetical protein
MDGHFVHFGKVGGTKAPRSSDDLIAFRFIDDSSAIFTISEANHIHRA